MVVRVPSVRYSGCLPVSIAGRGPYPLPKIYCLQQLTMAIPAKILCE